MKKGLFSTWEVLTSCASERYVTPSVGHTALHFFVWDAFEQQQAPSSSAATTFQSENFPLRFFCKQSLNWVINGMPRMVPVQCVREARGFSNLYRTGVFLLFTHTHAARPLALWRHTWDSKHERVCAKAHVWWEKVVHFEGLLDEGLCWRPSSIGEWSSSTWVLSWYHHTT